MKRAVVVCASCIVLVSTGCQNTQSPNTSGGQAGSRSVVVYSSADKEFAELIFRAYEQKTAVKVLPLYDTEETKTAGLTSRLVAEKDHPKADVFWSSDTSRAVALVDQGVAESYVPKESTAISARYRSPTGLWTGFAARIRVFLYNTASVTANDAPRSILDLDQTSMEKARRLRESALRHDVFSRGGAVREVGRRQGNDIPRGAEVKRRRDGRWEFGRQGSSVGWSSRRRYPG